MRSVLTFRLPVRLPRRIVVLAPASLNRHTLLLATGLLGAAMLLAWSAATTSYILFHDDALRLLNHRASSQAEESGRRIAQLEAQLVEERSRKLVEQKRVEAVVEQIRQRQIALEARHGLLSELLDGKGRPAARGSARSAAELPGMPSASPISDTVILAPADMREARIEIGPARDGRAYAMSREGTTLEARLAEISGELDGIEREQTEMLNSTEETIERRARRVRTVLADLGLKVPLRPSGAIAQAASTPMATGGPFVPVGAMGSAFERQNARARQMAADLDWLERRIDVVPLRRPVRGSVETTSGFGVRLDPFLRQAAFHTGIDFRGNTGDPARATAAGKVTGAGRDGGYGLMVEIDHGNGLSTRYAHLSAISVSVGDQVAVGGVVGRIGSTGRSTGPHLHYETRINGEPVDPQRFLRAGVRIADAL